MNNPPRSSADNTLPVHKNLNSRAVNLGDVESVGLVTEAVTERGGGGSFQWVTGTNTRHPAATSHVLVTTHRQTNLLIRFRLQKKKKREN